MSLRDSTCLAPNHEKFKNEVLSNYFFVKKVVMDFLMVKIDVFFWKSISF
jgi:hypothetical protein